MRTCRINALYRRERDALKGLQEEAEIQRNTLRRGKNFAFSKETCLGKERVGPYMTSRKMKWSYS